jgi:PAS domain S-box-containing protein
MVARSGAGKNSGSIQSEDDRTIAELKNRVAVLENELRSCREKTSPIDLAECKRAEEALRASEERYRSLIESIGNWVWETDQDFVLTYDSPRGREVLGYGPDEVIGRTPWSFMPEDELERMKLIALPAIARHDPIQRIENRLIKKDGSIAIIETTGIPLFDESGRYRGYRGVNHDITERKRTEAALKLTQFALDNFGEPAIWVAKDGRLAYANHAACRSLGYSREELLSMHIWDIDPNYPRERIRELWQVRKLDRYTKFESTHVARDGRAFPVEVTSSYILYGDEEYLITFDRDISERKRAEEALRGSEERFRAAFEQAAVGMTQVDKNGRFLRVNRKFCDIIGYSPEELAKLTIRDITYEPDLAEEIFLIKRLLAGELTTFTREKRYVRRDGAIVWVNLTVTPIFEKGMLEYLMGVSEDISERKRAEAELERVNRALRAISKCNEAVIHAKGESALLNDICRITVDVGGYRMAWVGYVENDTKKTVRPMAHHGFEDGYMTIVNVTWEDTERGRGPTGTAVRTGKPCVIRYVMTDPNFLPWREDARKRGYSSVLGLPLVKEGHSLGALTIYSEKPDAFDEKELSLLQDLADNLTYGIVSLRNQVKRAEAEAALKAAKADAELYVDLMGHDINNLNQVSLGFLELAHNIIETDGKLGEDNIVLLEKAMNSLNNSSQLIDNVRKLQREKTGQYASKRIDLDELLQEVKRQYSSVPNRDVTIDYEPQCSCIVRANDLLRDVFVNLVGNAIKHSHGIEKLVVGIRAEKVRVNGRDYCKVSVEDNGPGIPDEMKAKLFDRLGLDTTRARGKGFGLCLIKTLVDDYRGKFWVEDRVNGDHSKGARFVVVLPVAE